MLSILVVVTSWCWNVHHLHITAIFLPCNFLMCAYVQQMPTVIFINIRQYQGFWSKVLMDFVSLSCNWLFVNNVYLKQYNLLLKKEKVICFDCDRRVISHRSKTTYDSENKEDKKTNRSMNVLKWCFSWINLVTAFTIINNNKVCFRYLLVFCRTHWPLCCQFQTNNSRTIQIPHLNACQQEQPTNTVTTLSMVTCPSSR